MLLLFLILALTVATKMKLEMMENLHGSSFLEVSPTKKCFKKILSKIQ